MIPRLAQAMTISPAIASLNNDHRSDRATGHPVIATIDAQGHMGSDASLEHYAVKQQLYSETLGHNIPNVFSDYLGQLPLDWIFVMGYPISEPFWTHYRVGDSGSGRYDSAFRAPDTDLHASQSGTVSRWKWATLASIIIVGAITTHPGSAKQRSQQQRRQVCYGMTYLRFALQCALTPQGVKQKCMM